VSRNPSPPSTLVRAVVAVVAGVVAAAVTIPFLGFAAALLVGWAVLALCRLAASGLAVVLPPSFFSPDALLGLTQDAELDHSQFGQECGYAPLSLEEGFARTFGRSPA